jgi:hypothetical protein
MSVNPPWVNDIYPCLERDHQRDQSSSYFATRAGTLLTAVGKERNAGGNRYDHESD